MVLIEGQPPALLHREPEFVALEHAFERAAGGDGSALVVEGPPGIGKTSLLDAGASTAANLGLRVLRARGSELEQGFGFGVARQLFGAVAGEVALDGAVALAAPALGRAPAEPELDNPLFAALHGLHALLVELAGRGPIALVVDDLHWADEPSQRLLAYLAARISALPVALVVATWPVPAGTGPTAALMRDAGDGRRATGRSVVGRGGDDARARARRRPRAGPPRRGPPRDRRQPVPRAGARPVARGRRRRVARARRRPRSAEVADAVLARVGYGAAERPRARGGGRDPGRRSRTPARRSSSPGSTPRPLPRPPTRSSNCTCSRAGRP